MSAVPRTRNCRKSVGYSAQKASVVGMAQVNQVCLRSNKNTNEVDFSPAEKLTKVERSACLPTQ